MKMESLELPLDIIWDGEPASMLSPTHFSNASTEEILIFEDSFATELLSNNMIKSDEGVIEFSPEEFEKLLDIQQDLLKNMSEENQLNDQWLEQPINGPLDEYAPVQSARIYPVKGNTAQLLNEFNQVYDEVELTHLTPPETPPHTPPQTPLQAYLDNAKNQFYSQPITTYQLQNNQPLEQCKTEEKPVATAYYSTQSPQQLPSIFEQAMNLVQQSTPIEYDDALAEMDALVRSRAEDLAESSIDDDSSICDSSTCFSPRSETSSPHSEASTTDDSDWSVKPTIAIAAALKSKQAKQKRRPRQNRRSVEDRQSRKKEQNKSAANRYRQKKKAEIEILLDQERELQTVNEKLQKQYDEVRREAKYIKGLLREVFKAKGII